MKTYSLQRCDCRKSTEAFDPWQNILCEMPADLGEEKRGWDVISETATVAESSAYFSPVSEAVTPNWRAVFPQWNADLQARLTVIHIAEIAAFSISG